jgi:hypothetical protein
LVHHARIEYGYVKGNLISKNDIRSAHCALNPPGAASTAATSDRGLLEVLAGVLIACGSVRRGQVFGDDGHADGGQAAGSKGLRAGGDGGPGWWWPGEQLDGEARSSLITPVQIARAAPSGTTQPPVTIA